MKYKGNNIADFNNGTNNQLASASVLFSAILSSEIYEMSLENVSYDKHGNPKIILRSMNHINEDRNFSYNGNQKATVSGFTTGNFGYVLPLSGEFDYNDNGALTSDTGRDIVAIRYNLLNLPDTIQFKNGNAIYYTYNAAGQKLRTTHITVKPDLASPITLDPGIVRPLTQSETLSKLTTNYIGNHVLEGDELTMTLFPGGYIRKMLEFDGNENALGCFPKYQYYLQDYLGNNRDVLCTDNNGNWTVVQRNEYTPFGVSFPQTVGDAAAQPYKFGGKELDRMHGLDFYDFHARVYAPLDGGFPTVDPLAEKYPDVSPYVYCSNNPVNRIDPTGMTDYHFDEKGNIKRDADGNIVTSGSADNPHRLAVDTQYENGYSGVSYYLLADPENDAEDIQNGTITKLVFVAETDIQSMLREQGAFNANVFSFVWKSQGEKKFDYSFTVLPQKYPDSNFDGNKSNSLFLPEGDYMAHNFMNFGNYLWGATGATVGLGFAELQIGAHLNSKLNPGRNGYPSQWDSKDDQRSIVKGAYHAKQNNYEKK